MPHGGQSLKNMPASSRVKYTTKMLNHQCIVRYEKDVLSYEDKMPKY